MSEPGVTEPTGDALPELPRDELGLQPGDEQSLRIRIRIGNYHLKREIAVGGMGTVYEAVQDQPRRSVALKLMRCGVGSRGSLRRFEYESQLLARLRHPGIAQVFEAGTHRHGALEVPYYTMEYFPGARSITDYAETHKLTLAQRLELFARACDAIHHAHQRGIIHRDIKPGNILVDGTGQVKVIDFGVARALDSDLASATQQTDAERLVGTLQYMSPEQCELDSSLLDGRSDVYALGVVMYELVCGRLPYDVSRTNLSDATRMIREQPPASPRLIKPELSADIETILLQAMHKDRDRRYQLAEALAADVRHALAGEPIEARRDSRSYVLKKRATAVIAAHRISMWLVILAAACVLANLLVGTARLWPPMNLLFERVVTSRIQPVMALPPLSNVRMIAMQDGTDFAALAQREGIEGVNPADLPTLRKLHGRTFEKLVGAGARVLAVDIMFRKPADGSSCRFEQELLDGIRKLQSSGCEVVLTAGERWDIGEDDLPASLCLGLARQTKWGFITGSLEANTPWSLDLVFQPADRAPMPSLALTTCAAYWHPQRYSYVSLDPVAKPIATATISYAIPNASRPRAYKAPAESFVNKVPVTRAVPAPRDDPSVGRKKGDVIGGYILHIPSDMDLRQATVNYSDVLGASQQQLRQWFEGKAVVLGDHRAKMDGPFVAPDGRSLPGFIAHAVGIDAILSQDAILAPPRVDFLGVSLRGDWVFGFAGALAGALLGLIAFRVALGRWAVTVLLLVVLLSVSILVYRHARILYDPLVAMVGAVLAVEGVSYVSRVRRDRLI